MSVSRKRPPVGAILYFALTFSLGAYFTFAAVQGDYGLFRRVQVDAENSALKTQLTQLSQQVAAVRNKTRRLSDTYLDLDLLDEQARSILGMARPDEIVIR